MKISIVIATYNSERYLRETLRSLRSQTEQNFEVVFVDGGSTDTTLDIIKTFLGENDLLISEPDQGIYDALNKGIKHSTGDAIMFLHSDDFLAEKNVLYKISRILKTYDVTYSDLNYVKSDDIKKVVRRWKSGEYGGINNILYGWMPPHPTLVCKSSVYRKLGCFNKNMKISGDFDFVCRLFNDNSFSIYYLDELTYVMRLGGSSNKSLSNIIKKLKEDFLIFSRYSQFPFFSLLMKNFRKLPQLVRHK